MLVGDFPPGLRHVWPGLSQMHRVRDAWPTSNSASAAALLHVCMCGGGGGGGVGGGGHGVSMMVRAGVRIMGSLDLWVGGNRSHLAAGDLEDVVESVAPNPTDFAGKAKSTIPRQGPPIGLHMPLTYQTNVFPSSANPVALAVLKVSQTGINNGRQIFTGFLNVTVKGNWMRHVSVHCGVCARQRIPAAAQMTAARSTRAGPRPEVVGARMAKGSTHRVFFTEHGCSSWLTFQSM